MIIAVSILGLISLNSDFSISNDQNKVRAMIQNSDSSTGSVKILNHQMIKSIFGNWIVKGKVEKIGSLQNRYSIINVNFFDKEGTFLNSSSTKLYDLKPGEIKDFEVEYKGNVDPESYKIELNTYT
jgi:hypothetical protein